jgi:hypothetical protein
MPRKDPNTTPLSSVDREGGVGVHAKGCRRVSIGDFKDVVLAFLPEEFFVGRLQG